MNQALGKEGILPFTSFWASGWPANAPLAGLGLRKSITFSLQQLTHFQKIGQCASSSFPRFHLAMPSTSLSIWCVQSRLSRFSTDISFFSDLELVPTRSDQLCNLIWISLSRLPSCNTTEDGTEPGDVACRRLCSCVFAFGFTPLSCAYLRMRQHLPFCSPSYQASP